MKSMGGSTDSLRLAVVGLGRMGQLHLRTLRRLPGVSVVALIDVDHHKTDFASLHGIPFLTSCKELIGRVDAAVIATPAHEHLVSTLPLLEAGIHCLVEKPLATSMLDLDKLGAAAVRRGTNYCGLPTLFPDIRWRCAGISQFRLDGLQPLGWPNRLARSGFVITVKCCACARGSCGPNGRLRSWGPNSSAMIALLP